MRIIVYDAEFFEPLTVVEIPAGLMRQIEQRQRNLISIPVMPRPMPQPIALERNIRPPGPSLVVLRMEPIVRGDQILFWMAIADDPELALLLRAAFLPGQVSQVKRMQAEAYFEGLAWSLAR